MATTELAELLPAERRLLDTARAGESCDLIDPEAEPTPDEVADWNDPDREIRAVFLAKLITHRHPGPHLEKVAMRGAIITGRLEVIGPIAIVEIDSRYCRFDDDVSFRDEVTFSGHARFDAARFDGDARFDARFSGDARFDAARFDGDARFDAARFDGHAGFEAARFNRDARFDAATFNGDARFEASTFNGDAGFDTATFNEVALFYKARFSETASFDASRFSEVAWFHSATFSADAWFHSATFGADARFDAATFNGDARFDAATFNGDARFEASTFTELSSLSLDKTLGGVVSFERTRFGGPINGVWAARRVVFDEVRFFEPVTVRLFCPSLSLVNVELRSGGTLQVRGDIDATAATFGARTTISDPGTGDWNDWLAGPHQRRVVGGKVSHEERAALAEHVLSAIAKPTSVWSLRRATVADLELSAIDLTDCRFAGAHGLDRMRIDSACTLPTTPTGTGFRRPLRFTRRDAIAEERIWREQHATWEKASTSAPDDPVVVATDSVNMDDTTDPSAPDRGADTAPPDATLIAGIYRSLRKGLEDSSNEPGAADFYYGEMEMRRLAHRTASATGRKTSLAEHWLLTAYWAVSGYGLRAWRAFAAIAALIMLGAIVFATVGVKDPPGSTREVSLVDRPTGAVYYVDVDKPSFNWGDAFELAGRNSVALLRNPSNTPDLTPIGTATDIALRLSVPVLLALAVLAIRGRTKR
ncbi:pentapeptide repeat-containing protein [Aldersonia sp. NBC_00410]|uniref:pentapeptide repeat-containing protein n=1 Tax=Aldersonia sp. NBC_00410 TaxID=2975954 RepID=UPI00225B9CCB|nr:pentapeptide repeat-containing protein [Aldersonia sp. NBC_00410]MCX5044680.1 pentapeptide repeat-containing protein [Aldersonia sp. NBC_00410]